MPSFRRQRPEESPVTDSNDNTQPTPESNVTPSSDFKRSWPRRILSVLLRFLKWTTILVCLLLVLVVLLLAFFPANWVKEPALDQVRALLNQDIEVDDIGFSAFSGLHLRSVRLGPPKGYTKDVFTLKELRLDYSLWSLLGGEFVINEVLIDSPRAQIETIDGKMNVQAMLDNMATKETPKEELEPEPEPEIEEPGEPSDFKVILRRFALQNLTAWVDDGNHVIDFDHLDVEISGFYSQIDSHFDVHVGIQGQEPETANLLFSQKDPLPVEAEILLALGIDIAADQVITPKSTVDVNLRVATQKLETQWPLDPVDLKVALKATADLPEDTAQVESLNIHFNDTLLLDLQAGLVGLMEQKQVALLLKKLDLPLDLFAPYAKAFVKDVDFGGHIRIENLDVKGDVPKLLAQGLPDLNGVLLIDEVWADYGPANAKLNGLNLKLDLLTRPVENANGLEEPALYAGGWLTLKSARVPQATIRNLRLDLDTRADGLAIEQALAKIKLAIPTIEVDDPGIGHAVLAFSTDIEAGGNLADGQFTVDHVNVNISDTIKLHVDADAQLNMETQAIDHYRTAIQLQPIDFKKALALVPSGIRKQIPKMKLAGSLGLDVKSEGRIPAQFSDPMALPVTLDALITLADINLDYPDQQLTIHNFGGTLQAKGKPADMAVTGLWTLAQLDKLDQFASLSGLRIPLDIRVTPEQAKLDMGVQIDQLKKEDQAAKMNDLALSVSATANGKLLKQTFDKLAGQIDLTIADIIYAKEVTTKIQDEHIRVRFDYLQNRKTVSLSLNLGFEQLEAPEQQVRLDGFDFTIDTEVQGVDIPLVPNPDQHAELVWVTLAMDLAAIHKSDIFKEPLTGTNLRSKLTLHDMRDADLETFAFAIPTLGVRVDMSGKVWGILDKKLQPPDFKTNFPEFDVQLFAGLDISPKRRLIEGIEAQGLAGIRARARSLPDNFARLEGFIVGENFSLWQTSKEEREIDDPDRKGKTIKIPVESRLHLDDFDADVPLIQIVNLETLLPVEAKGNIFEESSRNVLYDTMRTYLKQQSNFHIEGITFTQKIDQTKRKVEIDEIAMDMLYTDNTFAINRLYVDLLGGGISGSLQAQITAMPPAPFDMRLHFENQITGVNLARLTQNDPSKVSAETELSSLVNLDFGLRDLYVDGRIDITRLSLAQLDKVLAFLDPAGKDPSVQQNRALINSWYVDMINPQVKLVSMWVKYGNLNMDIIMDAWFFVGDILNNTLEKSRVRRLNIIPILKAFIPTAETDPDSTTEIAQSGSGAGVTP